MFALLLVIGPGLVEVEGQAAMPLVIGPWLIWGAVDVVVVVLLVLFAVRGWKWHPLPFFLQCKELVMDGTNERETKQNK